MAIVMLAMVTRLWFGRAASVVAALMLASLPIAAGAALRPTADIPELAMQLAALAASTVAFQRQSRWWAVAAGVAAGMAIQARDTSLLLLVTAAIAWLILPKERRTILLWAGAGLFAVTAAEMLVYLAGIGDPLLRYRLALGHVAIPSSQLPPGFDTSRGPLFNPDYIRAWSREQGINVQWALDPWLNLVASPLIGRTLMAAAIVVLLARTAIPHQLRRTLSLIGLAVLLYSALLVYGLAIDPKPRMFLLLGAGCSVIVAVLVTAAWRHSRRWSPAAAAAVAVAVNIAVIVDLPSTRAAEGRAKAWISGHRGQIEIDAGSLDSLALVPEARALPRAGSGRPLRIISTDASCNALLRANGLPRQRLVDSVAGSPDGGGGELCLVAITPAAAARKT